MLSFYFLLKLIRRTQVCNFPRVFTNKTAAEDELVLHKEVTKESILILHIDALFKLYWNRRLSNSEILKKVINLWLLQCHDMQRMGGYSISIC